MATNPTLLAMPLAENGTKNVIPETQATAGDGLFSQSTGFPAETSLPLSAGGVAPSREDFNGMANLLGGVAYYAQKGWQFQFDAGQDYFAGCIVRDTTDGKLYECINDVAAGGSVPSADAVNWIPVDPSFFLRIADAPATCTPFAFPSATYITLQAGNAIPYTPPANGYLVCRTGVNELGGVWDSNNEPISTGIGNTLGGVSVFTPVRKGEAYIYYAPYSARFYYAVGEEP